MSAATMDETTTEKPAARPVVLVGDQLPLHLRAEAVPGSYFSNRPRLHKLSLAEVLAFSPCSRYPERVVRDLYLAAGLPERADLLEVLLALRGKVPAEDLLWLALRDAWFVKPEVTLRWLAADFASASLPIWEGYYPEDARPRRSIEAARQRALDMIDDAAGSAAWSAAESAARSAAESAARSAAWSAAGSAARSAAWSAAESAAVDRIVALLGGAR